MKNLSIYLLPKPDKADILQYADSNAMTKQAAKNQLKKIWKQEMKEQLQLALANYKYAPSDFEDSFIPDVMEQMIDLI